MLLPRVSSAPMSLAGLDLNRTGQFFADVWWEFVPGQTFPKSPLFLVAHVLGSHLPFFRQIASVFQPVLFTPKIKSQDLAISTSMTRDLSWVTTGLAATDLEFDETASPQITKDLNLQSDTPLYVIDVGGKFAAGGARALKDLLKSRQVHVVEGTENGYHKYDTLLSSLDPELSKNLSVWSVARSRLKDPEDSLTGTAIVEATETIVRINYGLLKDGAATVFGYGKIGRSVAYALRQKHLSVGVVELDPLLAMRAQADGFCLRTLADAQKLGGYIFLATGSAKKETGLRMSLLEGLERDSLVTFVTSFDDELRESNALKSPGFLVPLETVSASEVLHEALDSMSSPRVRQGLLRCLHVLPTAQKAKVIIVNEGSPPNFLFEASCGPYLFTVFAGMLACLARSQQGLANRGQINVLTSDDENLIARTWLSHFSWQPS